MAIKVSLVGTILLSCLGATYAVYFADPPRTLNVTYNSTHPRQVLRAGEDHITNSWSIDSTLPSGTDLSYKFIEVRLCDAKISQKDKSCGHKIVSRPYSPSNNTFTWPVHEYVSGDTYFISVYAFDSDNDEVAFGQTTELFAVSKSRKKRVMEAVMPWVVEVVCSFISTIVVWYFYR